MRLVCPNCDAQYEIAEGAIPAEGRDVQCSNCGHDWFEIPSPISDGGAPLSLEDPQDVAIPVEASSTKAPARKEIDDDIRRVLQEEAAREIMQRDQPDDTLSTQTEMGLSEKTPDRTQSAALDYDEAGDTSLDDFDTPQDNQLPDIDEISSSLDDSPAAQIAVKPAKTKRKKKKADTAKPKKTRSGFRLGFYMIVVPAIIGLLIYLSADTLSEKVPKAAAHIETFVTAADGARDALSSYMERGVAMLKSAAGSGS
ncbi:MAG: zinc-ribbon domain-containing protein [Halocynthiibacter sp.]